MLRLVLAPARSLDIFDSHFGLFRLHRVERHCQSDSIVDDAAVPADAADVPKVLNDELR